MHETISRSSTETAHDATRISNALLACILRPVNTLYTSMQLMTLTFTFSINLSVILAFS